ncbi:MAG: nitrilase-related carbon-nitrogen hydrolase, partial [Armatimonadota bacterium]
YLPSLERWGVLKSDYAEGRYWPPIEIAGARVGVLICSESMFSAMGVERVQQGADVLAIVSNDSWFGTGCGVEQLARLSILRAVECRRSVVRASETGYSMLIDPCGRVVKQSTLYKRDAVTGTLPLSNYRCPFVQWGQFVPGGIAGIVVLALVLVVVGCKVAPASKKRCTPTTLLGSSEALRQHDGGFETGESEELRRDQKEGRQGKE